ncbi:hypothetical protein BB559_007141 [Furculomyces boomerangus]|uniref:CBS domain-containing protein n=2 Tax=Harpellales TaxID=61421 RepID=A0A2T9XYM2_9FUNG|nr:hypothetical protein BB559_007141 [Furculomyces boomerangus]PWA02629.1 hypothetical protein BB558_001227 [Smittium angustum]
MSNHSGLESSLGWERIQASDIINSQDVIQIETSGTAEDACITLIKNSISSIPLHDSKSNSYLGLFDLNDLVKHINLSISRSGTTTPTEAKDPSSFVSFAKLDSFSPKYLEKEPGSFTNDSNTPDDLFPQDENTSNESANFSFLNKNVLKLSDISTSNPFYAVMPESSLAQIIDIFSSGVHRVAVMCDNDKIMGILSQSSVIKYLVNNLKVFKIKSDMPQGSPTHEEASKDDNSSDPLINLLEKPLNELGLAYRTIWAVRTHTPVTSALYVLERQQISSLPIVNDSNSIIGSLSISDIKYIVLPKFRHLIRGTCIELVQKVRFYQGIIDGKDRAAVFAVHPDSTLKSVMSKLSATSSHRIWVTTGSKRLSTGGLPLTSVNTTEIDDSSIPSHPNTKYPGLCVVDGSGIHRYYSHTNLQEGSIVGVVSLTDVLSTISKLTQVRNESVDNYSVMN